LEIDYKRQGIHGTQHENYCSIFKANQFSLAGVMVKEAISHKLLKSLDLTF